MYNICLYSSNSNDAKTNSLKNFETCDNLQVIYQIYTRGFHAISDIPR